MTPHALGLLVSTLMVCWMWGTTYSARRAVVDMAWLYKPSIHGDDYKANCLAKWREYKGILYWTSIVTFVVVLAAIDAVQGGKL